ncbi:phytanoyl-CoA dioxygenase family protein (plasmid) [Streptomyces sp. R39]|uniref:Phytanoyl-CoA dioxygenase family protein n=1 Tax=Streptomyces sp. R39 TaxID=3238631 RepID=A0AB39R2Q4_9ACTN
MPHDDILPDAAEISFYREHGWYASRKIFTEGEIEAASEAVHAFYDGHRDRPLPPQLKLEPFQNWTPGMDSGRLRSNDHIVMQSDVIREFALKPLVGEVAGILAQTDEVRLFNSSLVYKPPTNAEVSAQVGWHVDRAYWQTCTSEKMLTAWIPLHDCDENMGTITMVDGSHRWAESESLGKLRNGRTFATDDVESLEWRLRKAGHSFVTNPIKLRKGEVSFHHCLTFHGSGPNRSTNPRISIIVHLQDSENEYRPAFTDDGIPISYHADAMCRKSQIGYPDYTDPDVFPVLWQAASVSAPA